MSATTLTINGKKHSFDIDPKMPLLWAIRDVVGLKGTKFGCGIAQCGACTVHLNGNATRSCVLPVSAAAGQKITTIEGLGDEAHLHAVQQAWIDEQVPQCGYCQSEQIMSATTLLKTMATANRPHPSGWNDLDMLIVGWVGWGDKLHQTHLTPSEQYTHISIWDMLSSPMLIGCDMSKLDAFTYNLLDNDEVIAIDQDPLGKAPKTIRDVWRQKNTNTALQNEIPAHGCLVLVVK